MNTWSYIFTWSEGFCLALHGKLRRSILELRGVTWHGITDLTPDTSEPYNAYISQTGWYSTYLSRRNGRLSWLRWLVTYQDGLHIYRHGLHM